MPIIKVQANSFRDGDDAQSLLIVDRFGPAWDFNPNIGETVAITAFAMPDDWGGGPVFVSALATYDGGGSAGIEVNAEVMASYAGTPNYGTPEVMTFANADSVFKLWGAVEVTPNGSAGTGQFMAIKFVRTNATLGTGSVAVKEFLVEYDV